MRQTHRHELTQGRAITMYESVYPALDQHTAQRRRELAPETMQAFRAFSKQVFADGALSAKTKQLIAVAAAHITQCPYCIDSHTRTALAQGATDAEVMEAIWVAAEMRAGAAYAHAALALQAIEKARQQPGA